MCRRFEAPFRPQSIERLTPTPGRRRHLKARHPLANEAASLAYSVANCRSGGGRPASASSTPLRSSVRTRAYGDPPWAGSTGDSSGAPPSSADRTRLRRRWKFFAVSLPFPAAAIAASRYPEAARYRLEGSMGSRYRLLGSAVPPLVSYAIGKALAESLSRSFNQLARPSRNSRRLASTPP